MTKHTTPLLDQLESGPWPSLVSDIKQEAAERRGCETCVSDDQECKSCGVFKETGEN
jgi:dissimilatory sulfite reductase alpha subunit (EC 1.8.99.1)